MQIFNEIKGLFLFTSISCKKSVKDELFLLEKIACLEKQIKEEQERTEKLKSVFLSNIYHEIRTPMNSIVGFSELLKNENLTSFKRTDFIDKVKVSSETFLVTLDQLIEASLIETGFVKLSKESFILDELMEDIHNLFIFKKHFEYKAEVALLKTTDKYYSNFSVYSDRKKLHRILVSLIDNALKFTDKGIVEFGYTISENNILIFHIDDSGIGVDERENELLFGKFNKLNYVFNRENKGLGLGLCIARDLIKVLGGEIWFESNLYGGTTFKFTIPIEKPALTKENNQYITEKKITVL